MEDTLNTFDMKNVKILTLCSCFVVVHVFSSFFDAVKERKTVVIRHLLLLCHSLDGAILFSKN